MENKKTCKCPICNQDFTPEDGLSIEEHMAKGIIRLYSEMQQKNIDTPMPCPRCGKNDILAGYRNALSRRADIYICPDCGTAEALEDSAHNPLPLTEWYIVTEILAEIKEALNNDK